MRFDSFCILKALHLKSLEVSTVNPTALMHLASPLTKLREIPVHLSPELQHAQADDMHNLRVNNFNDYDRVPV